MQLISHGDVPATVHPALAQYVAGDAVLEPFERITPAQFDVFVGRVAMGVRHDLGKGGNDGKKEIIKYHHEFCVRCDVKFKF